MAAQLAWLVLGLGLLVAGADAFVRGASGLALRLGIPPFVAGMLLVGFGTSAPELAVNLTAVANANYDLAVGNIVGSNIANVGLILGASALLAPLVVQMRLLRVEVPLLIAACLLLLPMGLDGRLGRVDALLLLAGFAFTVVLVLRGMRSEAAPVREEFAAGATALPARGSNALRLVLGLALLLFASRLMVDAAVALAAAWGMSELVVGLTVVAVGTSLPELASSLAAAWRRQGDIAVGNVVGSCLFNLLLILGLTAMVHPVNVAPSMLWRELPVMAAFAVVLYPMVRGDLRIGRREGAVLLLAFALFMAWQVALAMH